MQLCLCLIEEVISENYTISKSFTLSDTLCQSIYFYAPGMQLQEETLYLIPSEDAWNSISCSGIALNLIFTAARLPDNIPAHFNYLHCPLSEFSDIFHLNGLIQSTFDYYTRWNDQLNELYQRDATYNEYFKISYPVIQNPMVLYDNNYIIVADSRGLHELPKDDDWVKLVESGFWTPDIRRTALLDMGNRKFPSNKATYYQTQRFYHNQSIMNLSEKEFFLGTFYVLEYFLPISDGKLFLINHLGQILKKQLRRKLNINVKSAGLTENFLHSMLMGYTFTDDYIDNNLKIIGWNSEDKYCVLVFPNTAVKSGDRYFPKRLENIFMDCKTVIIENDIVLILKMKLFNDISHVADFISFVRDSVIRCGISSTLYNFKYLSSGYKQARAAIEIGNILNPTLWFHKYDNYAVEYLLQFALLHENCETLCHPAVGTLYKEDQTTGSNYLNTLELYLSSEKNTKKIAQALYIHRNTLIYRLEKITQLTCIDLDNTNEMEYLLFSIKLFHFYQAKERLDNELLLKTSH